MDASLRPTRLTWKRFFAVQAICAAPALLTFAALPVLIPWLGEVAVIPLFVAVVYVTPGVMLVIALAGLIGMRLGKDASRRATWRATAAAAGCALGIFVALFGALLAAAYIHLS